MNTVWRINLEIAVIKQSIPWSRRVGTSVPSGGNTRSIYGFLPGFWHNGETTTTATTTTSRCTCSSSSTRQRCSFSGTGYTTLFAETKGLTTSLPLARLHPRGVRPPLCSAPTSALVLSYRHCTTANYDCPNFFSLTVATSLAAIRANNLQRERTEISLLLSLSSLSFSLRVICLADALINGFFDPTNVEISHKE